MGAIPQRASTSAPAPTSEPDAEAPTISEATLRAAATGDRGAWKTLVDAYAGRAFALAKSRVGNVHDAEEITQSVFVTVAKHLRDRLYQERGRFEPWLFTIVMNRVRDFARKRTREQEGASVIRQQARLAGEPARGEWDFDALRAAIARLEPSDREILELRHHAEMGFKQISDMLNEPMGTLLARHHRALRKLKALLERDESGHDDPRGGHA